MLPRRRRRGGARTGPQMSIEGLYQADVLRTTPDATLGEVAAAMSAKDVGSLLVFEGDELVGVITERDLVRALDTIDAPRAAAVRDHMTPDPWVVLFDWDIRQVAERMLNHGIRHAPVMREGSVVGVVSSLDLVAYLALELNPGGGTEQP